jgi:hypothetical protein
MSAKKAAAKAPADKLVLYDKLLATHPKTERKGATMPYTSLNGHMFSLLTPSGALILRLSEEEREAFAKKYKTAPTIMYGAVMKEYVTVPDALLKKTGELKKYLALSYDYVSGLKPKPTAKKKK